MGDDVDDYWRDVIERVRTHPHEAEIQGNFGQTALHVACYRFPPLGAVEAILKARPGCTLKKNLSDETPLHLATEHASEAVQIAILKAGPEAAAMRDKYGDAPLHLACGSGQATVRFIQMLVEACPQAVHWKNNDGLTPIFKLPLKEEHEEMDAAPRLDPDSQVFEIIKMLLTVSVFGSMNIPNGCRLREMHAVAMVPCPIELISGILQQVRFVSQACEQDHNGMVPLALAAVAPIFDQPVVEDNFGVIDNNNHHNGLDHGQEEQGQAQGHRLEQAVVDIGESLLNSNRGIMDVENNGDLFSRSYSENGNDNGNHRNETGRQKPSLIESILAVDRRAATIPDNEGRYPLHHAIFSGKRWNEGIKTILNAAPNVTGIKQGDGLYPFMLAAFTQHAQCLDTIFNLLRMWPEVLYIHMQGSCSDPTSNHHELVSAKALSSKRKLNGDKSELSPSNKVLRTSEHQNNNR